MPEWARSALTWRQAAVQFEDFREAELEMGRTGLDQTRMFTLGAGGALVDLRQQLLKLLPGAIVEHSMFAALLASLEAVVPSKAAAVGLHYAGVGDFDRQGLAIGVSEAAGIVEHRTAHGDLHVDRWLRWGWLGGIGAPWVREDLCHKIGYGLGWWGARTRYHA